MWVFVEHEFAFEVVYFFFEGEVFVCEFFDSVAGLASERFGCTSLWVEADDSDAFSYPVFGDYDSGAV